MHAEAGLSHKPALDHPLPVGGRAVVHFVAGDRAFLQTDVVKLHLACGEVGFGVM